MSPPRASLFVLLVTLLSALVSPARAELTVELLVMGPGDDVFSRFGHVALRVIETGGDGPGALVARDRVFNFGITNFKRPNYIRDFLTGRVRFWGAARTYESTLSRFTRWDRTVTRYGLNLTQAQAQSLLVRLEHDVEPEHREYLYDTFRDNCATRLRDYLDEVTDGAVRARLEQDWPGRAYRDDVRQAFANLPHLLFLTEIIPGIPLDAPRSTWELTYHPARLALALATVNVSTDRGETSLVGAVTAAYTRQKPHPVFGWPDAGQAFIVWCALLIALLGLAARAAGPRARALLALLWLGPSSLLGVVLTVVAVGTIWPDMQQNWLLAAFVPLDGLLLIPAIRQLARGRTQSGAVMVGYLRLRFWLVALLTALGLMSAAFRGPLPPRLAAAAGLFLVSRALGVRRAQTSQTSQTSRSRLSAAPPHRTGS